MGPWDNPDNRNGSSRLPNAGNRPPAAPPPLPPTRPPSRRRRRFPKTLIVVALLGIGYALLVTLSPWSPGVTVMHILAAPNCGVADSLGLAPAEKGQPGYWRKHDHDGNGIACEPWPVDAEQDRKGTEI